jgi:uncharacterized membrane protein YagU involved in acid resistance
MNRSLKQTKDPQMLRGFLAGAAGGVAASLVMNVFLAGTSKAKEALEDPAEKAEQQKQQAEAGDDSTQKVADVVAFQVTGEHLSKQEKQTGGPIVHYVFGGLMGGVYGVMAEYFPATRLGAGTMFGSALFLGADEIAVPVLGLGKPPDEQPVSSQANHLTAHIVYGATVEMVRRGLRRLL